MKNKKKKEIKGAKESSVGEEKKDRGVENRGGLPLGSPDLEGVSDDASIVLNHAF